MSNRQVKRTLRSSHIAKTDDEIITTQIFPHLYLETPTKAQELISKVSGVTVTKTANEFPQYLLKAGTATELRSKFTAPPLITYTFIYALGSENWDMGWGLTTTTDKNYIFGGQTTGFPPYPSSVLLIKMNDYGEIIWSKTFGGDGDDWIRTIKPDPDGGYLLAGFSSSSSIGGIDFLLFHISEDGDLDWARVIGTSLHEEARGAYRTQDGGIIIAGYSYAFGDVTPQPLVIKLDSNLNIEYAYAYIFEYPTYFWDFIPTIDGNYLAVGRDERDTGTLDHGIVAKITMYGELIWAREIYGDKKIRFLGTRQLNTNEYLLAGYSDSFGYTYSKFFITKMSDDGRLVKSVAFGGVNLDNLTRIELDKDKNIIATGSSYSYHNIGHQMIVCKLSESLNLERFAVLNGNPARFMAETGREICETFDNGYLFVGYSTRYGSGNYDMLVIKTNKDLLVDDCPILGYEQAYLSEVSPYINELSPTVLDVKDAVTITTPDYVSYSVQPLVVDVCEQGMLYRTWRLFMEEWH